MEWISDFLGEENENLIFHVHRNSLILIEYQQWVEFHFFIVEAFVKHIKLLIRIYIIINILSTITKSTLFQKKLYLLTFSRH